MPIYLVRWPGPNASLVTADDEEMLINVLDEVADPGGCTWEIYEGPIWVDFDLPVKVSLHTDIGKDPVSEKDMEVDPGSLADDPGDFRVDVPVGDTASEMMDAIRESAFHNLHAALEASEGGKVEKDVLIEALKKDMEPLLKYSWRQANLYRQKGREAELMRMMGVTIPVDRVFGLPPIEDEEED